MEEDEEMMVKRKGGRTGGSGEGGMEKSRTIFSCSPPLDLQYRKPPVFLVLHNYRMQ